MFSTIVMLASKQGYTHKKLLPWSARRAYHAEDHLVLDPKFWEAIGRVLGNKDEMRCDSLDCSSVQCEYAGYKNPKSLFDKYMSCKWYSMRTDLFWKELLEKRNI